MLPLTRNLTWRARDRWAAALFLLPAVAGILLLRIYPIGSSLLLGLTETKLLGGSEFVKYKKHKKYNKKSSLQTQKKK